MFVFILTVDENVVDVDNNEIIKKVAKGVVNIRLESCWSICEAKRENAIFEMAISRSEGCLSLIARSNSDAVIGVAEVYPGELFRTPKTI